ncbi:MAG TPA: winged helix-turn-helix domain-containing protein [Gaiellaceae bacterium]|nr:winged helix-turn-helix domain-containing protein [Gaiellaceae bacterium]
MTEPWWKAPRRLRSLLEDGDLTATEYAILHYLAEAGADRADGTPTTYDQLARLFRIDVKTVYRALRKLRALDLVEYELKQGQRRPFRVYAGPRLRTLEGSRLSEVVSEVTSDKPVRARGSKAAPAEGQRGRRTSDTLAEQAVATETREQSTPGGDFMKRVFETYCSAGGVLELDEWRGALGRQAKSLQRSGISEGAIIAAASALGRARSFPGYLSERAREIEESGPPCAWEGLGHAQLSPAQLNECGCPLCEQWLAAPVEARAS